MVRVKVNCGYQSAVNSRDAAWNSAT